MKAWMAFRASGAGLRSMTVPKRELSARFRSSSLRQTEALNCARGQFCSKKALNDEAQPDGFRLRADVQLLALYSRLH